MDGSQQKEQRRFRLGPVGGGPPLFGVPSAFIPVFVSCQRYLLFTSTQKRLFATIDSPSLHRAAKYNGFQRGGGGIKACDWIQKWRKKELKWEITCSFHQQWLHWSMAEVLFLHKVRFSGGMKKVYVPVEEYVFMSAQMLHVLHTWRALYLTSGQFIIIIPIVSFTVILDLRARCLPRLQTMKLFLSGDIWKN